MLRGKKEKPFWFSSLGQMFQFDTIKLCRTCRTILVTSSVSKKGTPGWSLQFLYTLHSLVSYPFWHCSAYTGWVNLDVYVPHSFGLAGLLRALFGVNHASHIRHLSQHHSGFASDETVIDIWCPRAHFLDGTSRSVRIRQPNILTTPRGLVLSLVIISQLSAYQLTLRLSSWGDRRFQLLPHLIVLRHV